MRVHSHGDRIRPGRYAVRARFARSVLLLDRAQRALFVVDRSIGAGPLNLVVARPENFASGDWLDVPRVLPGRRYDSALPRLDGAARSRLAGVLQTALPRHAPPDSLGSLFQPTAHLPRLQAARDRRFRQALGHLAAGRLAAGARLLRGCGAGLTPAGDDFLCGWMLACRLQGQPARARVLVQHARGGNPVSNAFLEMAAQGRVHRAMKDLLRAPGPARVRAVCAFGHSSGADLLWGLWYGLDDSGAGPSGPE